MEGRRCGGQSSPPPRLKKTIDVAEVMVNNISKISIVEILMAEFMRSFIYAGKRCGGEQKVKKLPSLSTQESELN